MEVLQGMAALRGLPEIGAASIGNFDGVHRGHGEILLQAKELAEGKAVCVITFEPHPLTVLRPEQAPPRLTSLEQKHRLLAEAGADYLIELAPTPDVLGMTPEHFWEHLRDELRPKHLIEGKDFHFGKGRGGNIERLAEWAKNSAVTLHVLPGVEVVLPNLHVVTVSSTLIRWLVGNGRMREARICLGRPYALNGTVIEGFRRGRELGMPTANLRPADQVIPMEGIYAGKCRVGDRTYQAAISVGKPPTFEKAEFQIEAHLIGFYGDLYGQALSIEFLDWLRDQRQYADAEALKQQMTRDLQMVGSVQ